MIGSLGFLLALVSVLSPGDAVSIDTRDLQTRGSRLVNYHVYSYLRDMTKAMTAARTNEIRRSSHPYWDSLLLLKPTTGERMPECVKLDTTGYPDGDYWVHLQMAERIRGEKCTYRGRDAYFSIRTPIVPVYEEYGEAIAFSTGLCGSPAGIAASRTPWRTQNGVPGCKWKAFHDGAWLYLAVAVQDPTRKERVTIGIDPAGNGLLGFCLSIGADGKIDSCRLEDDNTGTDRYVVSHDWTDGADAVTTVGEKVWMAEVAIPFGAVDVRRGTGASRIGLDFSKAHKPSAYPKFAMVRPETIRHDWAMSLVDAETTKTNGIQRMRVSVAVSNRNDDFHAGTVRLTLCDPSGRILDGGERPVGAIVNRNVTADFELDGVSNGTWRLVAELRSPEGRLEAQMRREVEVDYRSLDIVFTSPCYRDCVFETMKLTEVAGMVVLKEGIGSPLELRLEGPDTEDVRHIASAQVTNRFSFAFVRKPKGDYRLRVGGCSRRLRNLPYRKGEVWFDANGVMYRDGVKTFPIGWFSDFYRYPHPGLNMGQTYWNGMRSAADVKRMADEVVVGSYRDGGCAMLVPPFQPLPEAGFAELFGTSLTKGEFGVGKVGELQKKAVRRLADTVGGLEGFLGYYLADEPEGFDTNPRFLKGAHDYLREIDPYHPTVVVDYSVEGVRRFHEAGDVMAPDAYSVYFADGSVRDPKRMTYRKAKTAASFGPGWVCPQVFDWHITMKGKPTSRGPTYDEIREQCLMALAGDARGLLFYGRAQCGTVNWDIWLGSEAVVDELLEAKDAFLAPSSDVAVKAADGADIVAAFKSFGDDALLIVVNCAQERAEATFLSVRFPKEMFLADVAAPVSFADGRMTTVLAPYESRVYRTKPWKFSPSAVRAEIAKREAARRKPGNLAVAKRFYTLQEQEMIRAGKLDYAFPRIVASTSADLSHRPHVFPHMLQDGFDQDLPYTPWQAWLPEWPDWRDGTAWVRVEFGEKKRFSRAVLTRCRDGKGRYMMDSGWLEANGRKIAAFKDAKEGAVTLTFDPVESDTLTFHPGPIVSGVPYAISGACLTEFEVYEK